MTALRTAWASDSAIIVTCSAQASAPPIPALHRWRDCLDAARIPGVRDVTVGSTSVAITIDPTCPDPCALRRAIESALREIAADPPPAAARTIDIPVCYDAPGHAPDLAEVATQLDTTPDAIASAHAAAIYTVDYLGFAPGFAYLSGLPTALHVPRHATPRARVPAGSVGIAGARTAVYPCAMPGGWKIIGRTFLRLFDPAATPHTLLRPGDCVRFVRTDPRDFDRLTRERAP